MPLKLERPIIFFDLETTGTNVQTDRIVEISMIKMMPDGTERERTFRINPERPIPAEATEVHHITDDDVKDCPTFKDIAKGIADSFAGCDIGGFNSNRFDIPLLAEELARAGLTLDFGNIRFVDVQTIYHKREPRNLVAAYKFYCGKNLENAHSANADTRATLEVFKAQLEKYEDLPNNIDELSKYSSHTNNVDIMGRMIYDDKHREVINFGKYKGKLAEEVIARDPSYVTWILQGDFSSDTKRHFQAVELRVREKLKKQREELRASQKADQKAAGPDKDKTLFD